MSQPTNKRLVTEAAQADALATKADATDARLTDARTPVDGSVTNAKVAANAAISADKLADGTTGKVLTAAERTKLTGVATAATANSPDATLLARANHTGTQSADTLTDGTTNKAFLATERTKLTGIAAGATANATDATLLARANHTGTQAASTVTGLATVATSGSYTDLTGKPTIPTVAAAGTAGAALAATDPTTTNARTPIAHAASHAAGGTDPVTVAAGQVTGLAPVATSGSYTDLANTPSVTAVQTAYKTTSSTYGSTIKSADPHLQFASVPVGTYLFEMGGTHTTATAGTGLTWLIAGTAAFTGTANGQQIHALNPAANTTGTVVTAAAGGSITNNGATAVGGFAVPLTVTTAGSLVLSLGSSNGSNITLNAGTWARLTKVA